ncbi:MAG: META domain-containing protein [Xanthobacteraceae bacterium]
MHQENLISRWIARFVLGLACASVLTFAAAADSGFPFGEDLRLDGPPMRGTKRVPVIEIEDDGAATIDLWCNTLQGQAVIAGDTITIIPGTRTERACPPDQVKADDDMVDALQQVTAWRRTANGVTLIGPRMLKFSLPTN